MPANESSITSVEKFEVGDLFYAFKNEGDRRYNRHLLLVTDLSPKSWNAVVAWVEDTAKKISDPCSVKLEDIPRYYKPVRVSRKEVEKYKGDGVLSKMELFK